MGWLYEKSSYLPFRAFLAAKMSYVSSPYAKMAIRGKYGRFLACWRWEVDEFTAETQRFRKSFLDEASQDNL